MTEYWSALLIYTPIIILVFSANPLLLKMSALNDITELKKICKSLKITQLVIHNKFIFLCLTIYFFFYFLANEKFSHRRCNTLSRNYTNKHYQQKVTWKCYNYIMIIIILLYIVSLWIRSKVSSWIYNIWFHDNIPLFLLLNIRNKHTYSNNIILSGFYKPLSYLCIGCSFYKFYIRICRNLKIETDVYNILTI